MLEKERKRLKRKVHIRKSISGTAERPRMTVFKSNRSLSIQIIDDAKGIPLRRLLPWKKNLRISRPI